MGLYNIIVILIYVIWNQTLKFILYFILSTIYLKLYINFFKYIYTSKTTNNVNANKKINHNFNIYKLKDIIIEFREIDAI